MKIIKLILKMKQIFRSKKHNVFTEEVRTVKECLTLIISQEKT